MNDCCNCKQYFDNSIITNITTSNKRNNYDERKTKTGCPMYSRHNPFVSSSSSWALSIGPTSPPRRRRRRPHLLPLLLIPSHSFAARNRTLLALFVWSYICAAVVATFPETGIASGKCSAIYSYSSMFKSLLIFAASKYETAYACESKTLTIECEPGDIINLIRANYGRFSITICNDHGNVEWSVNCMSAKSLRVLHTKWVYISNKWIDLICMNLFLCL